MGEKQIFISYRRDDSGDIAGRIHEYLTNVFGEETIFFDVVNSIPLGFNFGDFITDAIDQVKVMVVIIGKEWVNIKDTNGNRRLEQPDDWVRLEIETGLARGNNFPIIPIFVQNSSIRKDQLPITLKPLVNRNGMQIRQEPDFKNDVGRLIEEISALDVPVLSKLKFSFAHTWVELIEMIKKKSIYFAEKSVLTDPVTFKVGKFGYYLSLPPNTAAIITSFPDKKQVFMRGGYKELENGSYSIQYVDLVNRFITLPKVTAPTLEGQEVSLTVSIIFKVVYPSKINNNSLLLDTLFYLCESTIRNFITTHHYDEIIVTLGNEQVVTNYEIIQCIKEAVNNNRRCRALRLIDAIIDERYASNKN